MMIFNFIRQLIFNSESDISIILNEVLKIFEKENIISKFSIDIVDSFLNEAILLRNENMMFSIGRTTEEAMYISGHFMVDNKGINLIGRYNFQGQDKIECSSILINLYDKTGNYSIKSETDRVNNMQKLCFEYFDNDTINDFYKLFEDSHHLFAFDAKTVLLSGGADMYIKPIINETFSWNEGKDKIIEFINSTLHEEMSMEKFSKLLDVKQENYNYK